MAEYVEAIGRRKEASARVRLYAGTGEIVVNDKPVDDYFGRALDQMILRQPLALTGTEATLNISVKVQEHKDVLKVPISALRFTPPEGYGVNVDSLKKNGELNRIKSAETIGTNPQEGVLWLSDGQSIYPEKVETGINDGTYVEINGNGLKSNDLVVTGINHAAETSATTSNPFMPKMPSRRTR